MKTSELIYNIERAMENDREAIEAIYNYTYAGMYSLAYRLCCNKDAAEDILQESYIAAFSGLHTLHYKGEFWKWLKGIVINKWRDYSKSNAILGDALEYDSVEDLAALEHPQISTYEELENEQRNSELWRLINELPENQRVCIILFYYENMSVDEIAESLKIPVGSVKSRLYYGRNKLKKMMRDNDWFAGAALSGPIVGTEGGNSEMLAHVLAALEASKGSVATAAAKTAGIGVLLKLGTGLASLAAVAGMIYGGMLLHKDSKPMPDAIVSSTSIITNQTVTSYTVPTTTAATNATVSTTTSAKTVTFDCRTVEGGIMIEKYTGTAENVVIPGQINGQRVVSIGLDAFKYCRTLKSVSIPGSVTNIGSNAFRECTNLTSVTLHSGLNTIGDMAFLGCSSLKTVRIPPGVRMVGIYAFAYCTSLSSAEISEGAQTINYCAFYKCPNLRRVVLPSTVNMIGKDAFAGSSERLVLCVKDGTYSHTYALDNEFDFELVA